ncbi:MAG: 30S ribosomal protein S20 [Parcubacteria group bacterium GW2011_GWA2_42_11]|nr:MAG: 30S ribosomal protein S20 [Parcubacteria group bacterium GW2011_GWA2_42_11]
MPIKASAKKELRKGKRRQARNLARKNALKNSVKSVKKLFSAGQIDEAKKLIAAAYQAIDKAARRGVIKKNTAARKKSRLMKMLNK